MVVLDASWGNSIRILSLARAMQNFIDADAAVDCPRLSASTRDSVSSHLFAARGTATGWNTSIGALTAVLTLFCLVLVRDVVSYNEAELLTTSITWILAAFGGR